MEHGAKHEIVALQIICFILLATFPVLNLTLENNLIIFRKELIHIKIQVINQSY